MEKEVTQTSRNFPKKTKKIIRHHLPDRIFHWVMAVCMLVLLFTGFLPIVGVKFSWVDPHWIAGNFSNSGHNISYNPCRFLAGFLVNGDWG